MSLRCSWEVRHEGAPQRGKGMAELPVAVRTVAVSRCVGEDVPGFWQARCCPTLPTLIATV